MATQFRHEFKIQLGSQDYYPLRSRLKAALPLDPHVGPAGEYLIRSVYFDNANDKALREKLDGLSVREKFRVRWYNGDLSFFSLEKKEKIRNLCRKTACRISLEEARALFHGDRGWLKTSGRPVAMELGAKMETQGLRPRTLVEYRREPFLWGPGNVRVTLDRDVRGCAFRPDLLESDTVTFCAKPGVLLEVKYDEFLPDFIRDLVSLDARGAAAFSKYAACRGYL